jgi:hypothetical protein
VTTPGTIARFERITRAAARRLYGLLTWARQAVRNEVTGREVPPGKPALGE